MVHIFLSTSVIVVSWEYVNETPSSMKGGIFLDKMSDYYLLKDSASLNYLCAYFRCYIINSLLIGIMYNMFL
jgi:hypothetical protein